MHWVIFWEPWQGDILSEDIDDKLQVQPAKSFKAEDVPFPRYLTTRSGIADHAAQHQFTTLIRDWDTIYLHRRTLH
jgi:hypothetical protein